jgi:hypothetical protein
MTRTHFKPLRIHEKYIHGTRTAFGPLIAYSFGLKHFSMYSVFVETTNSMDRSPKEANSHSAAQNSSRLLRNTEVH